MCDHFFGKQSIFSSSVPKDEWLQPKTTIRNAFKTNAVRRFVFGVIRAITEFGAFYLWGTVCKNRRHVHDEEFSVK